MSRKFVAIAALLVLVSMFLPAAAGAQDINTGADQSTVRIASFDRRADLTAARQLCGKNGQCHPRWARRPLEHLGSRQPELR